MTPTRRPDGAFRAVLCPVDFSSHARSALQYAAAMAGRAHGTLTALYVNDPLLVSAAAAAYNERTLMKQSADELVRFVQRALGPRQAAQVRTAVALGRPAPEILKAVRTHHADLLVVGSEGLSGAPRLFFGSTTAHLLARSTVPVLAVPPGKPAVALSRWPGRPIVAAVDLPDERSSRLAAGSGSAAAARDVARAIDLARWFGGPLSLVHVVEPTRVPRWLSAGRAVADRTRLAEAHARLARLAARAAAHAGADGPLPETHVLLGRAPEQIAAWAADTGAGLVVLTLRGGQRLFGDRQGTTTYQVVCQSGTPVLAMPDRWRPPVARES